MSPLIMIRLLTFFDSVLLFIIDRTLFKEFFELLTNESITNTCKPLF